MNALITKYTNAAKHVIYDPSRFKHLLGMLGTKAGAIQAVHLVMAIIEKNKPIPPAIAKQLGVNIYLLMVDVAEQVTKHQADPQIVHDVVGQLSGSIDKTHPVPATMPSQGIIGSQMGAAA